MEKKIAFRAGAYIYIEGDDSINSVFIVEKGRVAFRTENESISRSKTGAGPGEIFGFISSLCGKPRMESAVASADSLIIELSRDRFLALVNKNTAIAYKIINTFADELRTYDSMIYSLNNNVSPLTSEQGLYSIGAYYFKSGDKNSAFYILNRYIKIYPSGSMLARVKEMIGTLEEQGIRTIAEPVRNGVYSHYHDNQIIFSEYEEGNELFIIKEGRVKISKHTEGGETILSILKEGDIFGELSIVSDKPRNATAMSHGKCVLLPVNREFLSVVIGKSPEILKKIFVSISRRVWFTFIRLESKLYEKPITRIYSFLENKLLEENISLRSREPAILNFGIDELLKMTALSHETMGESLDALMSDKNLNFNFGKIEIDDPSLVVTKAKFYKSRDRLYQAEAGEKSHDRTAESVLPLDEEKFNTEPAEPRESPSKEARVSSALFNELSDAVSD